MLYYLIGLFSFLSGTCLALSVHLYYKSKIDEMKEDWRNSTRLQRQDAYRNGYKNGVADEKIVQAAMVKLDGDTIVMAKVKETA